MKWILLGLLLSSSCAVAERTITAYIDGEQEELCCFKDDKSVTINKKDHAAFFNCSLLKNRSDRYRCANYFISPWAHYFNDYKHDI